MFRISLINMPFAGLQMPSLALTQIKSVLDERFEGRVAAEVHYINHDFARHLGVELSQLMANSSEAHNAAVGDWFFRRAAFPELPDNTEGYFRRFFPMRNERIDALKRVVLDKRESLEAFLDELVVRYKLDEADIVGFTSMFTQNVACFALARRIKERNPKVITVMGGANCESPMGQEIAKHVRQVDFVFSGPALKSFPQLVQHCLDGEADQCHRIRGVFSRRNCGLSMLSPAMVAGEELDINVPVKLDYDQFLASHRESFEGTPLKPILLFETSRGCWWGERAHCTFCGLNGSNMGYRSMEPPLALEQFERLFRYADRVHRFESVDNILPKSYIAEVLPQMNAPENVELFYEVKADLSEQDVETLARARVNYIQPGIEALNTSTLKLMKKGTSSFQNLFLLKNCITYNVYPAWNLLIGFPGEQEEVYKKYFDDIPLLTHLPPPSGAYPVRFDRYSPYFVQSKEYGLDLHPVDYYEFIYPFGKESLANLAYYFTDRNFSAPYIRLVSRWVGKLQARVAQWQARWRDKPGEFPKLYFKDGGESTVVFDSRTGKPVEHEVGEVGKQVLGLMSDKPKRLSDLTAKFGDIPDFDPNEIVSTLQSKGLIFQEGDRYLSLVHRSEPAAVTFPV